MDTDTILLKKILASANEIKAEVIILNQKIDSVCKKAELK